MMPPETLCRQADSHLAVGSRGPEGGGRGVTDGETWLTAGHALAIFFHIDYYENIYIIDLNE